MPIAVPLDWYRQYPKAYLREEPYVKGFYRRKFDVNASELDGRRALLRFGVIGYDAVVFVNGREAGRHKGDFTPCEFDVTNLVKPGENTLAIRVLTDFGTTHGTVPAAKHVYGSQWGWGNIKGGLWQSVELAFVPELYIETMLVNPVLKDSAIRVDYTIDNRSGREFKGELALTVTTALKRDPNKTAGKPLAAGFAQARRQHRHGIRKTGRPGQMVAGKSVSLLSVGHACGRRQGRLGNCRALRLP